MTNRYRCFIYIYLFLSFLNLSAQKEEYNWYFGTNAGLDFSTTPPTASTNSAMTQWEGCAVASDRDGNLLFYTNGINVYNKNHQLMLNGSGLLGHNSSTHSAIIVSHPGIKNRFYIFTTNYQGTSNGLRYSIVDMNGDNGLGEVISKNNLLYAPTTEKLLCIKHSNGKDFWVITHEVNSRNFRIFTVDRNGLNTTPTIQAIGTSHTNTSAGANAIGYIRANSTGTKIALAVLSLNFVELFDFDNSTGVLSNPITLSSSAFTWVYGLEFSPDDTKLYVSKLYPPSKIYQIDITSNDASQMLSTMYEIDSSSVQYEWGALKKAPDGKIYVARDNKTNLSIINNPNQSGSACNFVRTGILLNNKRSGLGLPTFLIWSDGYPLEFSISSNSQLCEGDTLKLFATSVTGGTYSWTGPNGFSSNQQNPIIPLAQLSHSGDYTLNVNDYLGNYGTKTIKVVINPKPSISLRRNFEICNGDAIKIGSLATGGGYNFKYFWNPSLDMDNPNIAQPTVKPSQTRKYYLILENEFACRTIDSVEVVVFPKPEIELGSDIVICSSDSIEIGKIAENGTTPYMYKWFPEDGLSSAYIPKPNASPKQSTKYILTVIDRNGCIAIDSVTIKVNEKPILNAGEDIAICFGESVKIPAYTLGGTPPFTYKWLNAATLDKDNIEQPVASPKQTTTYYAMIIDANGCKNYDTITIKVNTEIQVSAGKDTSICINSSLDLRGIVTGGKKPYQLIEWNPKEYLVNPYSLNPIFKADRPGKYKLSLKVVDSASCTSQSEIFITVKPQTKIALNKNSISFGVLDGCKSEEIDSILVTNEESEELVIEQIEIDGNFKLSDNRTKIILKPKEKIYLKIIFYPSKAGIHNGKLSLITGGCNSIHTIDLTGIKAELLLSLDNNDIDFGKNISCEDIKITKTLNINNNGTSPVTIDTRKINLKMPFLMKSESREFSILPNKSISLEFEFKPDGTGRFFDLFYIPFKTQDCYDSLKVNLSGSTFAINPEINLSAMSFPDLIGCENRYDSLIILKNNSEVDIELVGVENLNNFLINQKFPLRMKAGKSYEIPVSFVPKDNGNFQESLNFIFEPCHINIPLYLIGNKSGVSISNPNIVNFGDIIICNTKTSTKKIKLKNTSDSKTTLKLESFEINEPFKINLPSQFLLESGEEKEIELEIDISNTNFSGLVNGKILLKFSPCDIQKTIELKANLLNVNLESDGFKNLGIVKNPTIETIEFYNKSTQAILIDKIELDNQQFKISNFNYPIKLSGNETLKVNVELPKASGIYEFKLTAKSNNPCNLIAISGRRLEINAINAKTYVSLPEIWVKSSEIIDIPFSLDSVKNSGDIKLDKYRAIISFSKYLLEPISHNYSIEGDSGFIEIKGRRNDGGTNLETIKFLVLLGDTNFTYLKINEFIWESDGIEVVKTDGIVRIINDCYKTTRFVKNGFSSKLIQVKPNPVNDILEIDYSIAYDGYCSIYLSDINGKVINQIFSGYQQQGIHNKRISLSNLSTGVYNLIFNSEDNLSTQKLFIIK